MDLRSYANALKRSWWIIVFVTVLGAFGAGVAYYLTPPTYASSVMFYVSTPLTEGTSAQSAGQFAQARVNSYVVLLSSERVAETVVEQSKVDLSPQQVMKQITAEADLNTVIVTATVRDSSADRAEAMAQALADRFPQTVSALDNQGTSRNAVVINVVSGPNPLGVVAPRWEIYVGVGVLGGLVIGVLIALVRDLLDNTVRTIETARAVVGAPVLGSIRFDPAARRAPLVAGEEAHSLRAEAFRQLRTNLQFIDAADRASVLAVTSAVPGEGKSAVSVNLALSLAEAGERVLVIEGDLRRPSVATVLGAEPEVGLTNVLLGQIELDKAIQPWAGDERLHVLTSGPLPPNPAELLGGERTEQLMGELRGRYDKVIIDTPPLLPVTDAAVTSRLVDGMLMVVHHGDTTRDQLTTATRALTTVHARIVGSVLNMRKVPRSERRTYGTHEYRTVPEPSAAQAT